MADVLGTGKSRVAALRRARVRGSEGDQRGVGLIEALVALVVAGSVILALAYGLLFTVRTVAATSEQQQLQRVLANLAESVKVLGFHSCGDIPADGSAADGDEAAALYRQELIDEGILQEDGGGVLRPAPSWRPQVDVVVELADVEFWHKVTFDEGTPGPGAFVDGCPVVDDDGPVVVDDGAQLLTIRAQLGDRSSQSQIVMSQR